MAIFHSFLLVYQRVVIFPRQNRPPTCSWHFQRLVGVQNEVTGISTLAVSVNPPRNVKIYACHCHRRLYIYVIQLHVIITDIYIYSMYNVYVDTYLICIFTRLTWSFFHKAVHPAVGVLIWENVSMARGTMRDPQKNARCLANVTCDMYKKTSK